MGFSVSIRNPQTPTHLTTMYGTFLSLLTLSGTMPAARTRESYSTPFVWHCSSERNSADSENFQWLQSLQELSVPHRFARRSTRILHHFARTWNVPVYKKHESGDQAEDITRAPNEDSETTPKDALMSDNTFFRPEAAIGLGRPPEQSPVSPPFSIRKLLFSLFPAQGLPLVEP